MKFSCFFDATEQIQYVNLQWAKPCGIFEGIKKRAGYFSMISETCLTRIEGFVFVEPKQIYYIFTFDVYFVEMARVGWINVDLGVQLFFSEKRINLRIVRV